MRRKRRWKKMSSFTLDLVVMKKPDLECDYNVINDQKIGALIGEMTIGH